MPSLKDIKKRIGTVKNTQQITKAMKMVSAARLRRSQDRVLLARPYAHMLYELMAHAAVAADPRHRDAHGLLQEIAARSRP